MIFLLNRRFLQPLSIFGKIYFVRPFSNLFSHNFPKWYINITNLRRCVAGSGLWTLSTINFHKNVASFQCAQRQKARVFRQKLLMVVRPKIRCTYLISNKVWYLLIDSWFDDTTALLLQNSCITTFNVLVLETEATGLLDEQKLKLTLTAPFLMIVITVHLFKRDSRYWYSSYWYRRTKPHWSNEVWF